MCTQWYEWSCWVCGGRRYTGQTSGLGLLVSHICPQIPQEHQQQDLQSFCGMQYRPLHHPWQQLQHWNKRGHCYQTHTFDARSIRSKICLVENLASTSLTLSSDRLMSWRLFIPKWNIFWLRWPLCFWEISCSNGRSRDTLRIHGIHLYPPIMGKKSFTPVVEIVNILSPVDDELIEVSILQRKITILYILVWISASFCYDHWSVIINYMTRYKYYVVRRNIYYISHKYICGFRCTRQTGQYYGTSVESGA